MNIWNIVFLVLVFLLGVAVLFLGSEDMKIRQEWNKGITAQKKKIEAENKKAQDAIDGPAKDKPLAEKTNEELSLSELKLKVQDLLFERSKAWFGCKPGSITADGISIMPEQLGGDSQATDESKLKPVKLVEVKLTVTGPFAKDKDGQDTETVVTPDDMSGVVYLFAESDENRKGAEFLGRFSVSEVKGTQVTLNAADILNESEVRKIQKYTKGTWAVYTTAPKDRVEGVLSQLSPDAVDDIIPAAKRAELLNPERSLKDFDVLLNNLYDWRTELQNRIEQSNKDIVQLKDSQEKAQREIEALQADKTLWNKRIDAMNDQRDTVKQRVDDYESTIAKLQEKIDSLQKQNEWYVARIAEYQLRVSEKIRLGAEQAAVQ